jgi:hypothetical protein
MDSKQIAYFRVQGVMYSKEKTSLRKREANILRTEESELIIA